MEIHLNNLWNLGNLMAVHRKQICLIESRQSYFQLNSLLIPAMIPGVILLTLYQVSAYERQMFRLRIHMIRRTHKFKHYRIEASLGLGNFKNLNGNVFRQCFMSNRPPQNLSLKRVQFGKQERILPNQIKRFYVQIW